MISYSLLIVLSVGVLDPRMARGLPSPTAEIRRSTDALRKTLAKQYPRWSPEADAQASSVQGLIDGIFDFGEIARRSLGPSWDGLTPSDQREFVGLLQRIIERRPLERRLHLNPDSAIAYQRESIVDGNAVVPSVVTTASMGGGQPTRHEVEYKLTFKDGHWRINDVVVNGVGLVEEYRSQFAKIIAQDTFAGLLRRMRKKLGESEVSAGEPAPPINRQGMKQP
jgi:phospholipid transport system substrate-binding protein